MRLTDCPPVRLFLQRNFQRKTNAPAGFPYGHPPKSSLEAEPRLTIAPPPHRSSIEIEQWQKCEFGPFSRAATVRLSSQDEDDRTHRWVGDRAQLALCCLIPSGASLNQSQAEIVRPGLDVCSWPISAVQASKPWFTYRMATSDPFQSLEGVRSTMLKCLD